MQLTISTDDDNIPVVGVEVDANDSLDNLKAILEVETGTPVAEQALIFNGKELTDVPNLIAAGVQNGDILVLQRRNLNAVQASAATAATASAVALAADGAAINPQAFIDAYLSAAPSQLATLDMMFPQLADAIRSRNVNRLQSLLRESHRIRAAEEERQRLLAGRDPMDPEVQAAYMEEIKRKNVAAAREAALEHTPEVFASVYMLYVDAEVNGVHLKAFVDSGAQMSIMTAACAEKCGAMRLVDEHFAGMAKGVGSSKILGRIHALSLKVQETYLPLSVSVLEQKGGPQFILGLDMLKAFQCCIDLESHVLRFNIPGSKGHVSLPFLSEHEIPNFMEEDDAQQDTDNLQKVLPDSVGARSSGGGAAQAGQPSTAPGAAAAAAALQRAAGTHSGSGAPSPSPVASVASVEQEAKVQRLVALGMTREMAVSSLEMAGGNEDIAASMLFGM